jgi:thiamine-monophosphate kinase
LPTFDADWLQAFSSGMRQLASQQGIPLVGGDTTRGPLTVAITAMGCAPTHQALKRSAARPGDYLVVSGTLGDAGLGLDILKSNPLACSLATTHQQWALARLHSPTPRISLGLALRGKANAAMDISDGLLQDLQHMLTASGNLGARLVLDDLPLSDALQHLATVDSQFALNLALAAGDDYELLFALPSHQVHELKILSKQHQLALTIIGQVTAQPAIDIQWRGDAWPYPLPSGYRHF